MRRTRLLIFSGALPVAAALAVSCGDDTPSAPTVITAAPAIVSPVAGATVESRNPTLTVSNVNVPSGTATYHFQVASDSGFASLVAEARAAIDRSLEQVRATPAASLLEPRHVGRKRLPSNVLGLLYHGAEHATRHTAQIVTTLKVIRGRA